MSSPDQEGNAGTPLEAERERLRKAGYTETEVSQILVARELGTPPQAGASGQGVLSNVLSSIVAVASHARMLIPTFRKDVTTVFDGTAPTSVRAGATASLAVKAVVVVVLGYAAWQEWQQHIIYATEKAAADASIANNEARLKQQQTEVGLMRPPTEEEKRTVICRDARGRALFGAQYGCPTTDEDKKLVCSNATLRARDGGLFGCPPP